MKKFFFSNNYQHRDLTSHDSKRKRNDRILYKIFSRFFFLENFLFFEYRSKIKKKFDRQYINFYVVKRDKSILSIKRRIVYAIAKLCKTTSFLILLK